jgi:hypothetical protein
MSSNPKKTFFYSTERLYSPSKQRVTPDIETNRHWPTEVLSFAILSKEILEIAAATPFFDSTNEPLRKGRINTYQLLRKWLTFVDTSQNHRLAKRALLQGFSIAVSPRSCN